MKLRFPDWRLNGALHRWRNNFAAAQQENQLHSSLRDYPPIARRRTSRCRASYCHAHQLVSWKQDWASMRKQCCTQCQRENISPSRAKQTGKNLPRATISLNSASVCYRVRHQNIPKMHKHVYRCLSRIGSPYLTNIDPLISSGVSQTWNSDPGGVKLFHSTRFKQHNLRCLERNTFGSGDRDFNPRLTRHSFSMLQLSHAFTCFHMLSHAFTCFHMLSQCQLLHHFGNFGTLPSDLEMNACHETKLCASVSVRNVWENVL